VVRDMETSSDAKSHDTLLLSREQLLEILRRMLRIRLFDEAAARVRVAHIPGSLHNSIGQEAEIVGACMALREDDYMTGNHRSHGHPIGKGVKLAPLMAELFGKKTGVCRGKGGSMHLAAFAAGSLGESGIVGGAMPAAVGAALSADVRGTDQVCLCFFGDGAANCGPFHETLNLAAVWKLPVVFLCENNGYAMSSPQVQTTSVVDVASRAAGYNIPGSIVDGQDAIAMYEAVSVAVARARTGGGPWLIEAKTYRYCHHQELDFELPSYRSDAEVAAWRAKDPIDLFVNRLRLSGFFTDDDIGEVRREVSIEVDDAILFSEQSAFPDATALLEDLFFQATQGGGNGATDMR
jgi:acetoin:2,6-dichlorophenolindophenol oxidoreductase subunit alpha